MCKAATITGASAREMFWLLRSSVSDLVALVRLAFTGNENPRMTASSQLILQGIFFSLYIPLALLPLLVEWSVEKAYIIDCTLSSGVSKTLKPNENEPSPSAVDVIFAEGSEKEKLCRRSEWTG